MFRFMHISVYLNPVLYISIQISIFMSSRLMNIEKLHKNGEENAQINIAAKNVVTQGWFQTMITKFK